MDGGAGHPGGGAEREPGAGAEADGAEDAGERDGAPHQAAGTLPPQELREARPRPQETPAPPPFPGIFPEAPRHHRQEDQVGLFSIPLDVFLHLSRTRSNALYQKS